MNPQIRFCRSFDGTRIAYTVTGKGPVIVRSPHWLTHLEYEWQSPLWRPWIEEMSRSYTYLRMDERACGLSDWDVKDINFDAWVRDFEAVVDAAGFERFALFGASQGSSIAIDYAVRHPERVSHLVLLGGYARGWLRRGLPPERVAELEAQLKLVEVGWGREDPAYRQIYSTQFIPSATLEELESMIEVSESAQRVRCPALLLHARGDRRAPFEEGRVLASLIPGSRLVPLDTDNHILLEREPAFRQFFDELRAFVPSAAAAAPHRARGRQRPDRRAPRSVREDGAQPHHPHLRQDRRREPVPGDRLRARARAGTAVPLLLAPIAPVPGPAPHAPRASEGHAVLTRRQS